MLFVTDWMKSDGYGFSSPRREFERKRFTRRILVPSVMGAGARPVSAEMTWTEVYQPVVCREGINKKFKTRDRMQEARLLVSDKPFEGSVKSRPYKETLGAMGVPGVVLERPFVHWAVEVKTAGRKTSFRLEPKKTINKKKGKK